MRHRIALFLALSIAPAAPGSDRPFLVLPGGALTGNVTPAPADWSDTDEVSTVQLETRPADPYSVNVWVVALDEHLYVHAGANRSEWVEHIEADPDVRLRVGDAIYALRAARVETQDECDRFSEAYEAKYGRRPRNGNVAEAYLFRLAPR